MEDALVLGEELSRHSEVPAALQAFHARRQGRVRQVVQRALENSRRMATPTTFYPSLTGQRVPASESMYGFLAAAP
jgi:2-polyprenyl-6-methoxyphenol hydroxylase-like FAD-dependent oxidoreductase